MRWLLTLAFSSIALAQSGGGPKPGPVRITPPWSDSLDGAQKAVREHPTPVLVVFVERASDTARIVAEVEQKDASRPEVRTLKKMGYARILLKRKELAGHDLAVRFGVKKLPGAVVADSYGNALFTTGVAKLRSTRRLLAMAKKAQSKLDKLVEQIKKDHDAGQRYLAAGNKSAAVRAFKKAASYRGHDFARKAKNELDKLARSGD